MWEIPAFKTASHGLITMARGNWPVIGHLKGSVTTAHPTKDVG